MADDLLLLATGTGTDHLLLTTGDDLLLTTSGATISGTMVGTFGALSATMVGTRIVNGVLVGSFGGLTAALMVGMVYNPEAINAELQPSLWHADLATLLNIGELWKADLQPSLWRADLQP